MMPHPCPWCHDQVQPGHGGSRQRQCLYTDLFIYRQTTFSLGFTFIRSAVRIIFSSGSWIGDLQSLSCKKLLVTMWWISCVSSKPFWFLRRALWGRSDIYERMGRVVDTRHLNSVLVSLRNNWRKSIKFPIWSSWEYVWGSKYWLL